MRGLIMAQLAPFNKLPSKPEYMDKVLGILTKYPRSSPLDIERRTKLTKTQVMCTLETLIREGSVAIVNQSPKLYSLKQSN